MTELQKELTKPVVLIFLGIVFIVGGSFGIFYLSTFFYLLYLISFGLLTYGIIDAINLGKSRAKMSGEELAREFLGEQRFSLHQRINKKQAREIKFPKNIDKLKEERKYLQKAYDKLTEFLV